MKGIALLLAIVAPITAIPVFEETSAFADSRRVNASEAMVEATMYVHCFVRES